MGTYYKDKTIKNYAHNIYVHEDSSHTMMFDPQHGWRVSCQIILEFSCISKESIIYKWPVTYMTLNLNLSIKLLQVYVGHLQNQNSRTDIIRLKCKLTCPQNCSNGQDVRYYDPNKEENEWLHDKTLTIEGIGMHQQFLGVLSLQMSFQFPDYIFWHLPRYFTFLLLFKPLSYR